MKESRRGRSRVGSAGASRRRGGFTIVELLVVVAIIGLLVTILMDSLRLAREHGYNAVCKANLRQLWQAVHAPSGGNPVDLPAAAVWTQLVRDQGAGGCLRCPKDSFIDRAASLADITLVQYHNSNWTTHSQADNRWEYAMPDILAESGEQFQLRKVWISPDILELWFAANNSCTDPLNTGNGPHSVLRITFGSDIELRSFPSGRSGNHCISEMFVFLHGQEIMRLTGRNYLTIDPPYYLPGEIVSYAMNDQAGVLPKRPEQVYLVEYEKTMARIDDDLDKWLGKGRHPYGKLNMLSVDGAVRGIEEWKLYPNDEGLWLP